MDSYLKKITKKWVWILPSSFLCVLMLFFVMAKLISTEHDLSNLKSSQDVIEFSMHKLKSQLQQKKRKLPEKKKIIKPPPFKPLKPTSIPLSNFASNVNLSNLIGDFGTGGNVTSNVTPVVRISPQYPINAAIKKIEGWVLLQFDITSSGNVSNPKILKNYPSSIFNKEALRAIVKWKYKPKIENGKPVTQRGIQVQLNFNLE